MRCVLLVLCFGTLAQAHSGFNTLVWQETLGPYTLTVLEDLHVTGATGEASVLVQLSSGEEAAPAGTHLSLELVHKDMPVYVGELPFVAKGTSDGKTFFSSYTLTLPIREAGLYSLQLSVDGPLGRLNQSYLVRTQEGPTLLEYLPSLLILTITLGGLTLLFIPLKRKESHETHLSRAGS